MKVKSESEVAQSCLTLSDPMDCHSRKMQLNHNEIILHIYPVTKIKKRKKKYIYKSNTCKDLEKLDHS